MNIGRTKRPYVPLTEKIKMKKEQVRGEKYKQYQIKYQADYKKWRIENPSRYKTQETIKGIDTKEIIPQELDGDMGICSHFGCAIKLSMQEALFGSKCIKHC